MNFSVIVGNPPYDSGKQLHQKFFNRSVELLEDGGVMVFLQPGTPYLNKKPQSGAAAEMQSAIKTYETSVEFIGPKVFENAHVHTDLSVTFLRKKKSDGKLRTVTYKDGRTFENVDLETVNALGLEPYFYERVVEKYRIYVEKNGSLVDVSYSKTGKPIQGILRLQRIRGNIGKPHFYSFISDNPKNLEKYKGKSADFGLYVDLENTENVYAYLRTYVARFALALRKIRLDQNSGEFALVPLVDFSKTWTDAELVRELGLTDEEFATIKEVLPDYHGIG